jgi:hypothetical protein
MAIQYGRYGGRGSGSPIQSAMGGGRTQSLGLFDKMLKNRPLLGNRGIQNRGPRPMGPGGFWNQPPRYPDPGNVGRRADPDMWGYQIPVTGDPQFPSGPTTPGYGGPGTVVPQMPNYPQVGGPIQQGMTSMYSRFRR